MRRDFEVLPVLDVMGGVVVHGRAGKRETYRPIESRVVDSAVPVDVAKMFRDVFGLHRMYVADLDGLMQERPQTEVIEELLRLGVGLLVDMGVRGPADIPRELMSLDRDMNLIVALESLGGRSALKEVVNACGAEKVVFSLDLRNGRPVTAAREWEGLAPMEIAQEVVGCGVREMIVLDVATVGMRGGVEGGSLEICRRITERWKEVSVITGGGVRSIGDLMRLRDEGTSGALVATALHDGGISPAELRRFLGGSE